MSKSPRFHVAPGTVTFGVALAVCFAGSCFPARAADTNSWRPLLTPNSVFAFRGAPAVGDFDGDRRADVAVAQPRGLVNGAYRYRVQVLLSAHPGAAFDVDSGPAGGLHISARDVDGDRVLDLVITTEFGREPVGVWINNGHGQFTRAEIAVYPPSIWQVSDRSLEIPRSLPHPGMAFVVPNSGSVARPAPSALPPLADTEWISRNSQHSHRPHPLSLGHPFRAPPPS